ncbi:hypothetical protein I316_04560 [Kwoniella heveanensis BCC8398]|uniref:Uncharacterized protein n=1 Tax=Kwoniella heveanensis BCC8398 TaxID=1296120 RepID=A0A1B9GSB1_9TREE|nr:hypothetical protein I316_04560 [Kwoniella heveanensis BCC8398]
MVRTAREPNLTTPQILRVSTSSATSSRRSSGGGSPSQPVFMKVASTTKSPFSSSNNKSPSRKRAVLGEREENVMSPRQQHPTTVKSTLTPKPRVSLTPRSKSKDSASTGSPTRGLSGLSRFIAKSPQTSLPGRTHLDIPSSSSPIGQHDSFSFARPGSTPYAPRASMPMRLNEDDTLLLDMAPPNMDFSSPPYGATDDSDMEAETSRAGARRRGGLMTPADSQEVSFGSPSRTPMIRKPVQTASLIRNPISRLPTPPSSQAGYPAASLPPTPQVASSSRSSRIRARPSPTPLRRLSKEPSAVMHPGDITAEWDTPLKMGEDASPNPRKKKSPRLGQPGGTPTRVRATSTPQDRVEVVLPQRKSLSPKPNEVQTPATAKPKAIRTGRASRTPSVGLSKSTSTRRSSGGNASSTGETIDTQRLSTPGPSHLRTVPASAPQGRRKSTAKIVSNRSRTATPSASATRSQAKSRRDTISVMSGLKTPALKRGFRKSVGMTPRDQALSGRKLGMLPKPIHGSPGDDPLLLKPYYEPDREGPGIGDGQGLGMTGIEPLQHSRESASADHSAQDVPVSSPFRFPVAEDMTLLSFGSSAGDVDYFDSGTAWSDDGSDAEGGAGEDTFIHVKQRQVDRSNGQALQNSILQDTIVEEEDDTVRAQNAGMETEFAGYREESPFAPTRNLLRPHNSASEDQPRMEPSIADQQVPTLNHLASQESPASDTGQQKGSDSPQHEVASASPLRANGETAGTFHVVNVSDQIAAEDEVNGDTTLDMEGGQWDASEPEITQIVVNAEGAQNCIQESAAVQEESSIEQLLAVGGEAVAAEEVNESVEGQEPFERPSFDKSIGVLAEQTGGDAAAGDITQDAEDTNWDVSDNTVDIAETVHAGLEVPELPSTLGPLPDGENAEQVGNFHEQGEAARAEVAEVDEEEEEATDDSAENGLDSGEKDDGTEDVTIEVEEGDWDVSVDTPEQAGTEHPQIAGTTHVNHPAAADGETAQIALVKERADPEVAVSKDRLDLSKDEGNEDSVDDNDHFRAQSDDHEPEEIVETSHVVSKVEGERSVIEADDSLPIPSATLEKTALGSHEDLQQAQTVANTSSQSAVGDAAHIEMDGPRHVQAANIREDSELPVHASPRHLPAIPPVEDHRSPTPSRKGLAPSESPVPVITASNNTYRSTTPAFSPPQVLHLDASLSPALTPRAPFVLIKNRGDLTLAPTPRILRFDRSSKSPAPAPTLGLGLSTSTSSNGLSLSLGDPVHGDESLEQGDALLEKAVRTLRRLSALRSLSPPTLPVPLFPSKIEADSTNLNESDHKQVMSKDSPIVGEEETEVQSGEEQPSADMNIVAQSLDGPVSAMNQDESFKLADDNAAQTSMADSIPLPNDPSNETTSQGESQSGSRSGSLIGDVTIEAETSAWDMSTEDIVAPILDDQSDSEGRDHSDHSSPTTSDGHDCEHDRDSEDAARSDEQSDAGESENFNGDEHSGEQGAQAEQDEAGAEAQEGQQEELSPPPAEVPEKIILRLVETGIIKLEPASDDEDYQDVANVDTNQGRSTTPAYLPLPATAASQSGRGSRQLTPRTPQRTTHLAAYKRMLSASPAGQKEAADSTVASRSTTENIKSPIQSTTPRFAPSTPPSRGRSAPAPISTTPTYSPPARSSVQASQPTLVHETAAETGAETAKRMLSQRVRGKASRLSLAFIPSSEPTSPVSSEHEQVEQGLSVEQQQHDYIHQQDEAETEAEEEGDTSVVVRRPRRSLQDELLAAAAASTNATRDEARDAEEAGNESFRSVVEVSSLDPKAAARAAAILKLNHAYIEHGVLSRSKKGDESALTSIRKSTSHSEAEKRELLHEAELEIVDSYRRSQTRSPSRGARELSVARSGMKGRGRSMSVMSFMTEDYPVPGGYIKTPKAKVPAQSHQLMQSNRKRQRPVSATRADADESAEKDLAESSKAQKERWGVPEWKTLEKVYRREKELWTKEREVKALPGGLIAWARRSTLGKSSSSFTADKAKEWDCARVVEKFLEENENKGWNREMLELRVKAIERRVNQIQEQEQKNRKDSSFKSTSISEELATPANKKQRSTTSRETAASSSSYLPATPLARAAGEGIVPPSTIRRVMGFVWGASKSITSQTPGSVSAFTTSAPVSAGVGSSGLLGRLEQARNVKGKGKSSEQGPILPTAMTTSQQSQAHMEQVKASKSNVPIPSSLEKSIVSAASSASASAPPRVSSRIAELVTPSTASPSNPAPFPVSAATTTNVPVTIPAQPLAQTQPQPYKRLYPTLEPPMTQRSSAIAKLFPDSVSNPSLFTSTSSTSSTRSRRSLEFPISETSVSMRSSNGQGQLRRSGSGSGSVKDLVKNWEDKKEILTSKKSGSAEGARGRRSISGR